MSATEGSDDVVDVEEASELLGVSPDRVQVMVEEGLLYPIPDTEPVRFTRAAVLAASELGA